MDRRGSDLTKPNEGQQRDPCGLPPRQSLQSPAAQIRYDAGLVQMRRLEPSVSARQTRSSTHSGDAVQVPANTRSVLGLH